MDPVAPQDLAPYRRETELDNEVAVEVPRLTVTVLFLHSRCRRGLVITYDDSGVWAANKFRRSIGKVFTAGGYIFPRGGQAKLARRGGREAVSAKRTFLPCPPCVPPAERPLSSWAVRLGPPARGTITYTASLYRPTMVMGHSRNSAAIACRDPVATAEHQPTQLDAPHPVSEAPAA